jgi:hypothetical protein
MNCSPKIDEITKLKKRTKIVAAIEMKLFGAHLNQITQVAREKAIAPVKKANTRANIII